MLGQLIFLFLYFNIAFYLATVMLKVNVESRKIIQYICKNRTLFIRLEKA